MGKSIKNQIKWNKCLYNTFVDDAILTDLEKKVLYARVWESDKWTTIKMALEWNVSRTTINNAISSIRKKYDDLYHLYPDKYPRRVVQKIDKIDTKRV